MCHLIGSKVIVEKKRLESQLQQKGFGERSKGEFVLDLNEAIYLLEKKKLEIGDKDGKKLSKKKLLALAEKKEKKFYTKFLVYRNLREQGYCPKTGFKFGADFRVYPKGKKPGKAHTQWVVNVLNQSKRLSMTELNRMTRLASSIKTELVLAIVDSENDVNYYSIKRNIF